MSWLGVMIAVVTLTFLLYTVYKYIGCINASDSANQAAENLAAAVVKTYAGPVGTYGTYTLPSKIEGHAYSLEIVNNGSKKGVLVKVQETRCGVSMGGAPFNAGLYEFPKELKNATEENITLFLENTPNGVSIGRKSVCAGCIQVENVSYDSNYLNEYVRLNNSCETQYDLTGWTMKNQNGQSYAFPRYILHSESWVWIFTRNGTDKGSLLHWCRQEEGCASVWNDGDTLELEDVMNNTCILYKYK